MPQNDADESSGAILASTQTAASTVSRRAILGASALGSAVLVLGEIGGVVGPASSASATTPPATAAEAAALAIQQTGRTRAQMNSLITDSPWSSYSQSGQWCAWFASWFMRSSNVGYQTWASKLYEAGAPVSSPAVGDVVYYPADGHVGMVVGVTNGVAAVVEGNAGDAPGIVKYRTRPYSSNHLFSRPAWTYAQSPVPQVAAISPASGYMTGGDTATITGANFSAGVTVSLGGAAATVTSVTSNSITITTPPHAEGLVDVVVSTVGGTGSIVSAFAYVRRRRNGNMSTVYWTESPTGNIFALAGDGAGTAGWLDIPDFTTASVLVQVHHPGVGNAVHLNAATWAAWKNKYLGLA